MRPIEKLKEILCEYDNIRKDIMELRDGCLISINGNTPCIFRGQVINGANSIRNVYTSYLGSGISNDFILDSEDILDIIGNPICSHHLIMYLDNLNNGYKYCIGSEKIIWINNNTQDFGYIDGIHIQPLSLEKQSNETIAKIINFLEYYK